MHLLPPVRGAPSRLVHRMRAPSSFGFRARSWTERLAPRGSTCGHRTIFFCQRPGRQPTRAGP
jgi:hypothetical protein